MTIKVNDLKWQRHLWLYSVIFVLADAQSSIRLMKKLTERNLK